MKWVFENGFKRMGIKNESKAEIDKWFSILFTNICGIKSFQMIEILFFIIIEIRLTADLRV